MAQSERESRISVRKCATASIIVALIGLGLLIYHAGVAREMAESKAWKHALTTFAALLAVVVSMLQAVKAFEKARHHKTAADNTKDSEPDYDSSKASAEHEYDFQHFRSVGALWGIGAVGALVSLAGELIDFYHDAPNW